MKMTEASRREVARLDQLLKDFMVKFKRNPTLDEACKILGLTGEEKEKFLKNAKTNAICWKDAKNGIECTECGGHAMFVGEKRAFCRDGLGYDGFKYECTGCQKEIEKEYRAPNLDGVDFEPYVTKYKRAKED